MAKRRSIVFLMISVLLIINGCAIPFEKYNKQNGVGLNNAPYSAYYQEIRKKIYHYAYKNYNAFEQGNVSLAFKVLNNGKVFNIIVDRSKTDASDKMIDAAVKAVEKASPFLPFPGELKQYPELNFKVAISFELGGYLNYAEYTDSNRCPIDKIEMKEIPIVYGKPTLKALEEAGKGRIILGGCFVGKNSPKVAYVCPACKKMWLGKTG